MSRRRDWGLPNWEIEAEYEAPSNVRPLLYFAWQFLRRNHEYRKFWCESGVQFVDDDGGCVGHIRAEAEARFGLLTPCDPSNASGSFFAASGTHELRHFKSSNGICSYSLEESEIGYIFDMTMPLEGQFKKALKSAKALQAGRAQQGTLAFKNTKIRTEKYITYLRILDADDAAADEKEIGDRLFPTLENTHPDYRLRIKLRDFRNAAQRLRDFDYRLLALVWANSKEK